MNSFAEGFKLSWTRTKAGHALQFPLGAHGLCVEARVDSQHPEAGCRVRVQRESDERPMFQLHAFQVSSVTRPADGRLDSFVRENKLIMGRCESTSDPVETLHVFRDRQDLAENTDSLAVTNADLEHVWWQEWILSQQTSTLEAKPIDLVSFGFQPDCNLEPLSKAIPGHFLIANSPVSCLVACHSSDFHSLDPEPDFDIPQHSLRIRLRVSELEKGVIRRCRLLIAITCEKQARKLNELSHHFEASRLPLST